MALAIVSDKAEKVLNAAFATNELSAICKAIDAAVIECGVTKIARDAGLDRTTLYRAFRLEGGPALNTMVQVMRVLGFGLAIKVKDPSKSQAINRLSAIPDRETSHVLTAAFRRGDLHLVIKLFAEALGSQENISELARKTIRSREALYRAFAFPRTPRFSTALSLLHALNLRFAVERLQLRPTGQRGKKGTYS